MQFAFINLKYKETRRGVEVNGEIIRNNKIVGQFQQKPYCACIPSLNAEDRAAFIHEGGKSETDYAEELLRKAEDSAMEELSG